MRKANQAKGVFCLEGPWESDLSVGSSVRPLLELLRINAEIPYIHRECSTGVELEHYLSKWTQKRYSKFPILYLASHGEQFGIQLTREFYDLDTIADTLGSKCSNRIIMISSCSTLKTDKRHLKRFLRTTNSLAICGYRSDVDWMRSAAFELLLFYEMQVNEFSGRGISSIQNRAGNLSKSFPDLHFRMVTVKDSA